MKFKSKNPQNFIGTHVQSLTYNEFDIIVKSWLCDESKKAYHIAVINAYCTVMAFKNPILSKIYNTADLTLPDGMPFVYWLRAKYLKPCDQFDSTNILIHMIKQSAKRDYRFYFYGGSEIVLSTMIHKLKNKYPYINIAGYFSPPFRELNMSEKKEVIKKIKKSNANIICVGLGTPKQDYWINEHIKYFENNIFLPCGAVFDFFGGRIKKSPRWISKLGFEWLYRLLSKDFNRLLYRYTVLNIIFVYNFIFQITGIKNFKITKYD